METSFNEPEEVALAWRVGILLSESVLLLGSFGVMKVIKGRLLRYVTMRGNAPICFALGRTPPHPQLPEVTRGLRPRAVPCASGQWAP